MAEHNLFCDQANCAQAAAKFCFSQGATKTKACLDHISTVFSEEMQVYDISAFTFSQSQEDIIVFESRLKLVHEAARNVEELKRRCLDDLDKEQYRLQLARGKVMEVVERAFQELFLQTKERGEEIYRDLDQKLRNIEKLLQSKGFQLSSSDRVLCGNVPSMPLFRVVMGDCGVPVAETIISSFHILPFKEREPTSLFACSVFAKKLLPFALEQAEKGRIDIAEGIGEYMQEIGVGDCPDFHMAACEQRNNATKQLRKLLPKTISEIDVLQMVESRAKKSAVAREAGNYEIALKKVKQGRELLQLWNLNSPTMCLEEGIVLSHFAEWSDADAVLRQGLELEMTERQESLLTVQLSNALALTYIQAGQWKMAQDQCEWTFTTWKHSGHQFELLTALFFSHYSSSWLGVYEINTDEREWLNRIVVDSPQIQCLLSLIYAITSTDESLTVQNVQDAVELTQQILPSTFYAASSRQHLALLYEGKCAIFIFKIKKRLYERDSDQAINELQMANEIFEVHFPRCVEYAVNQALLGTLFFHHGELDQAEQLLLQTTNLISSYFPPTTTISVRDIMEANSFTSCSNPSIMLMMSCFLLTVIYKKIGKLESIQEQYAQLSKAVSFGSFCPDFDSFLQMLEDMESQQAAALTEYEEPQCPLS